MKTQPRNPNRPRSRPAERGVALLVMMVLLAIMATLAVGNSRVLDSLHQDLKLVEKKQLRKFDVVPAPAMPPKTPGRKTK